MSWNFWLEKKSNCFVFISLSHNVHIYSTPTNLNLSGVHTSNIVYSIGFYLPLSSYEYEIPKHSLFSAQNKTTLCCYRDWAVLSLSPVHNTNTQRIKTSARHYKPFHFISNRCREQSFSVFFLFSTNSRSIEPNNKPNKKNWTQLCRIFKETWKVFCVDFIIICSFFPQ